MDIAEFLGPPAVLSGLKAAGKKPLLQALSLHAAQLAGVDPQRVLDVVLERERLSSTGVGQGVAIPHGRPPELERVWGVFAQLDPAIEFGAIDSQPVDLVFLLLAPDSAGADHLKALARISRTLRDRGLCEKLRRARSADALYALLTSTPQTQAA